MSSENSLTIKPYKQGFVVKGQTYPYRDELKKMGGVWNANLTDGGNGWFFQKNVLDELNSFVNGVQKGKIKPAVSSPPLSNPNIISKQDFLSLVERVERLELALAHPSISHLPSVPTNSLSLNSVSLPVVEEDSRPKQEEVQVNRLLRTRK